MRIERVTTEADLERMTDWMYRWWGQAEGYARDAVRESLRHSLQTDRLPVTFGLYLDDRLVGMYQFTYADLFVRPDLYPWLANVYLDPAFRGRGLGRALLCSVRENAAALGIPTLYLFTETNGLYERFGWEFAGEIETYLTPHRQRLYRLSTGIGSSPA